MSRYGQAARRKRRSSRTKEILDSTYWRCPYGEHIGYTVANFENEAEAKELVPEPLKSKLIVRPVDVFSYDEMMQAHK